MKTISYIKGRLLAYELVYNKNNIYIAYSKEVPKEGHELEIVVFCPETKEEKVTTSTRVLEIITLSSGLYLVFTLDAVYFLSTQLKNSSCLLKNDKMYHLCYFEDDTIKYSAFNPTPGLRVGVEKLSLTKNISLGYHYNKLYIVFEYPLRA